MSPAGDLGPRPRRYDESAEEYAAYISHYRQTLLEANPWLNDPHPHRAYWLRVLKNNWLAAVLLVGFLAIWVIASMADGKLNP